MDLEHDWPRIRAIFEAGIASSKHCALASVDAEGQPHVTPVGFTFLNEQPGAFYFEQYLRSVPLHLARNRRICLMTVNSSTPFWLRALGLGRFSSYPGLRLYGEAGALRAATRTELARLQQRIGIARFLPGSKLIWSGLETVRDLRITAVRPVVYPRMMEHLERPA